MSDVHIRQLLNPTTVELDRAAATVATAFAEDLWCKMLLGGDLTLLPAFRRAILASFTHIGEIWVATHGGDDFAGVAAFIRPGQDFASSEEQKAEIAAFFAKLPPDVQGWWTDYLGPKINEQEIAALGEGAVKDAWNLATLGVHPAHRGRGIAKALVEVLDQKAAAERKLATLQVTQWDTQKVDMYKKWGYEVKGERGEFVSPIGTCYLYVMAKHPPSIP